MRQNCKPNANQVWAKPKAFRWGSGVLSPFYLETPPNARYNSETCPTHIEMKTVPLSGLLYVITARVYCLLLVKLICEENKITIWIWV